MRNDQLAPEDHKLKDKYRFECRTCPYQMVLDRRYYERKDFEFKDTEDVLGGAEAWKNVDKTDGKCSSCLTCLIGCMMLMWV